MPTVLRKLFSPAGFLLALLFFVLPFAAVSCADPELGSLEVSFTGLDLVTGGAPSIEVDDRSDSLGDADAGPPPAPGAQVLAIITAALAAAGLGTIAIRPAQLRLVVAGATAAVAGLLLAITEMVALSNLESDIRARVGSEFLIGDLDLVHTRIGFWLSLAALAFVTVINIAVAVRAWVRK